jgi:hypothetical protein
MKRTIRCHMLSAALLLALSSFAEAGPPLICYPFETSGPRLLPWGHGEGWNTPDPGYDLRRLPADTLSLLDADAPVLTRMENIRRAVIYAARNRRVAEQLLTAVVARAAQPNPTRLATFDAGYLIESYRQAAHMFGHPMTTDDGYRLVVEAIKMGEPNPEMEFAAALMTEGSRSRAHVQRARSAAGGEPLLAQNLSKFGW